MDWSDITKELEKEPLFDNLQGKLRPQFFCSGLMANYGFPENLENITHRLTNLSLGLIHTAANLSLPLCLNQAACVVYKTTY